MVHCIPLEGIEEPLPPPSYTPAAATPILAEKLMNNVMFKVGHETKVLQDVSRSITVAELLGRLAKEKGVSSNDAHLLCGGKELREDKLLKDYDLQEVSDSSRDL